jgi:hypothetical protein
MNMDSSEIQPDDTGQEEIIHQEGAARQVSGKNVQLSSGVAGQVSAEQNVTMTSSVAGIVSAGQDMQMDKSGAQIVAVGNNLHLANGSLGISAIGNDVKLENGMIIFANAGNQVSLQNGMIGVAFSPQLNLKESQVLLTTPQAAALGAALGAVFAVLTWILRKMK